MRTRRYPKPRQAELFPELIDVLLRGWDAPVPSGGYPEGERFRIFFMSNEELEAVWRKHRRALLKEWRRRGGRGYTAAEQWFEGRDGEPCLMPAQSEAVN